MNEVRVVESARDAIESSPHVTEHQRWRRIAHWPEHSPNAIAGKKRENAYCFCRLVPADCPTVQRFRNIPLARACVLCDQAADAGRFCAHCLGILPWNDTFCECCGQALVAAQPPGVVCETCQAQRPPYDRARAALIYDFPVDDVIKAIKFRRHLWYAPAFAELLLPILQKEFTDVDALLPVPLHRWRQMTRGFNQSMELCRPLCKATGLPILTQAVRVRATIAQTGLNALERKRNLKNAFAISGKPGSRHPLIIDDVITTGVTCSQLSIELLRAGASSVSVLTVARAYTGVTGLKV